MHKPTLCNEALEMLNLKKGDLILDCTVGCGGHALEILKRIQPEGRLIGIDADEEQLQIAKDNLKEFGLNQQLFHENFKNLDLVLENCRVKEVDGILFDLGVSSYQLDSPQRGFSFRFNAALDMRLDKGLKITAFDLVNNLNRDELARILMQYGQERFANRIANLIVRERERSAINTTSQLARIIERAKPRMYSRLNPATKSFQAFRIAVNKELDCLEEGLEKAINHLKNKGRLCVISFHSLEDRIVKNKFKEWRSQAKTNTLTKKPICPGQGEIFHNPRSRSAKLRAIEKI